MFAGLKPVCQSDFSPKEIQSQHHSVMETKMREVGAIREFSTKTCSDPIKMLIEMHSVSIFC